MLIRSRANAALAALFALLMIALLTVTGVSPAMAAGGVATITKALDSSQGAGFTAPNTFNAGSTVRYRLTYQCASLTVTCVSGDITDVLDPRLEFVQVVVPSSDTSNVTSAYDPATNTVTAHIENFQDGTGGELILIARVKDGTLAGTIPNTASIQIPDADPVQTPNVPIQVPDSVPAWTIDKTKVSPAGDPAVDNQVTYRVFLHRTRDNQNVPIQVGEVVDTFPDGAIVVDAGGGTVDYTNNTITWQVGTVGLTDGWQRNVTLMYPSTPRAAGEPTFENGDTVVNTVDADVTYANGQTGTHHDDIPLTLTAPKPATTVTKTGTGVASPGASIAWKISATNSGNTTLHNPMVTDASLPSGVENLVVTATPQTAFWPSGPTVYEQFVGGQWIALATYTGTEMTAQLNPAATGIRAYPVSGIAEPGTEYGEIFLSGTVSADAQGDIRNCAVAAADGGVTVAPSCATTEVSSRAASIGITKIHLFDDAGAQTIEPGDEFTWGFGVTGDSTRGIVDRFIVTDILPAGFTYQRVECVGFYGTGGGIKQSIEDTCSGTNQSVNPGILGEPTITPNIDGNGATGLTWNVDLSGGDYTNCCGSTSLDTGRSFNIRLRVTADPGLSVGAYTNDVQVASTGLPTVCRAGTTGKDVYDIDGDGDVDETVCSDDDDVQVAAAAIISAAKYDSGAEGLPFVDQETGQPNADCPDVDSYTRYPCVAQTTPGGPLSYRFVLQNIGNVSSTDYVMYDILPIVGDTGVSQTLAGSARETEWTPVLTGPVTVVTAPDDADPKIEYNLTSNPCRPELNQGIADGSWQASCDDTWYTASQITDWTTVKSFRIKAFQPVQSGPQPSWDPIDKMEFQADLRAPLTAPQSTEAPLDLSIAWNSFAHREYRLNGDGTRERLLPSEPRKVGVIVPFVLPDVYAVGDYVWYDDNRDGKQDSTEAPVPGVTVTLLDEDGKPAVDANGFPVPATTTDDKGHYSFDNLPAGNYQVRFSDLPAGFKTTVSTTNGAQAEGTDSNVPADLTDEATTPVFAIGPDQSGMAPVVGTDGVSVAKTINRTIDMGISRVLYSVGDYVWIDADRDGLQSRGEIPVEGVKVELLGADGTVIATTTTDGVGHYVFDGLQPGDYSVRFSELPAGYQTTAQNNDGDQTSADDSNTPAGAKSTATTPTFTLGGDEDGMSAVVPGDQAPLASLINRTIDMGLVQTLYAVGDYVWVDADHDGVQDEGETPVKDITVELLDANGTVIATTTTDEKGHYVFDSLPAGDYQVRFSEIPTQYVTTLQNNEGGQTDVDDSNTPAGAKGTATTPLFTLGEDQPGMSAVESTDGVTVAGTINRTIDMGLYFVPVVSPESTTPLTTPSAAPTPAPTGNAGTPAGLALTGGEIAGLTIFMMLALLTSGLGLTVFARRRSARQDA